MSDESEKFKDALRKIVSVPKAEIQRREKAYKEDRKLVKVRSAADNQLKGVRKEIRRLKK